MKFFERAIRTITQTAVLVCYRVLSSVHLNIENIASFPGHLLLHFLIFSITWRSGRRPGTTPTLLNHKVDSITARIPLKKHSKNSHEYNLSLWFTMIIAAEIVNKSLPVISIAADPLVFPTVQLYLPEMSVTYWSMVSTVS